MSLALPNNNNAVYTEEEKFLIHCVSKNDTALAGYNFDLHQPILIIFGRNVAKKVNGTLFSTSPNISAQKNIKLGWCTSKL